MRENRDLVDSWEADDVVLRFASAPAEELIAWALEQWGTLCPLHTPDTTGG